MSFSERSDIALESDELARALAACRAERREVLDLTVAAPAVDPDRIARALRSVGPPDRPRSLDALVTAGSMEAVILYAGRREALRSTLRLLCDPGDEVLGPEPAPPWLGAIAHAEDVGLVSYPLVREDRWSTDAAALFDAITPRTRAIVVMSPNVPTGAYPSGDELEALASFGLPLIVDEVDFDLALDAPAERVRAMTVPGDALVVTLSARLELPEMPLAWVHLHGPRALAHEATERLEAMRAALDPPAPPIDVLWPLRDVAREAIHTRASQNLAALRAALGDRAPHVEGGMYAPIAMPSTEIDARWARRALERGVLVEPGSRFGLDERDAWLIVGLLTPPEVFDAGVTVLARLA